MRETEREREHENWGNWNRERGIGTGELGELEPKGEGNERGMGTEQLGNANGELYKPVIIGKMGE
jgi:hypothetical protein